MVVYTPPFTHRKLVEQVVAAGEAVSSPPSPGPNVPDARAIAAATSDGRCLVVTSGWAIPSTTRSRRCSPRARSAPWRSTATGLTTTRTGFPGPRPRRTADRWSTRRLQHNLNAVRDRRARRPRSRTTGTASPIRTGRCADTELLVVDFASGATAHLFITWAADLAIYDPKANDRERINVQYLVGARGHRLLLRDPGRPARAFRRRARARCRSGPSSRSRRRSTTATSRTSSRVGPSSARPRTPASTSRSCTQPWRVPGIASPPPGSLDRCPRRSQLAAILSHGPPTWDALSVLLNLENVGNPALSSASSRTLTIAVPPYLPWNTRSRSFQKTDATGVEIRASHDPYISKNTFPLPNQILTSSPTTRFISFISMRWIRPLPLQPEFVCLEACVPSIHTPFQRDFPTSPSKSVDVVVLILELGVFNDVINTYLCAFKSSASFFNNPFKEELCSNTVEQIENTTELRWNRVHKFRAKIHLFLELGPYDIKTAETQEELIESFRLRHLSILRRYSRRLIGLGSIFSRSVRPHSPPPDCRE